MNKDKSDEIRRIKEESGDDGKIIKKTKGGWRKGNDYYKDRVGEDTFAVLSDYLINEGFERFVDELDKLKGKEYVMLYERILSYIKPKAATEVNVNIKTEYIIGFDINIDSNIDSKIDSNIDSKIDDIEEIR